MRVASLPSISAPLSPRRPGAGLPSPSGAWSSAPTRLPTQVRGAAPALPVPPLDTGFFFPTPATPTAGLRTLRRLRLHLRGAERPRAAIRRALGLWELLGGGPLSTARPLPPSYGGAGSLLRGPNLFTGLRRTPGGARVGRPRARRLRSTQAFRLQRGGVGLTRGATSLPCPPRVGLGERLLRPAFRPRRRRPGAPAGGVATLLGGPTPGPRAPGAGLWSRRAPGAREVFPDPIPQVRYRPGLARAWRLLRLQFCLAWGLPWARQRRLTRFVSQLRGVAGLGFLQMCAGGVGALLKESGLSTSTALGTNAWVNGRLVRNPFFQLYRGDRVTVGPHSSAHPRRDLQWLAPLETAPLAEWEVDGLTRAVTVLRNPGLGRRPRSARPLPFLTFRMYNWKYRH